MITLQRLTKICEPVFYGQTRLAEIPALVLIHNNAVIALGFIGDYDADQVLADLTQQLQCSAIHNQALIARVMAMKPLPCAVIASDYQWRVWEELLKIPTNQTCNYGDLAQKLSSHPRAVGGAVGANLISYFIPCHRVMGKNGTLRGYRWGLTIKQQLLTQEHHV